MHNLPAYKTTTIRILIGRPGKGLFLQYKEYTISGGPFQYDAGKSRSSYLIR